VLGISMGGMIAQELALRSPEMVATLTLGCTSAGGPGSFVTSPEVGGRLAAAWSSGDRELAIRTGWEVNVSPSFALDEAEYAAFRDRALRARAPLALIALQMQAIGGHDVSARLGDIRAPTLVIHGDGDVMLAVENGRLIASKIPGARLEILEGVGHLFWVERPRRSAELIRENARRRPLAGAPAI
jgi:3-oxoadipate enol-lactonase